MRQSWETMTSVSAGHIIQTPTQPVGSGRPQRESNPGPPHQESRALPQSYRAPLWKGRRKRKSTETTSTTLICSPGTLYSFLKDKEAMKHNPRPMIHCSYLSDKNSNFHTSKPTAMPYERAIVWRQPLYSLTLWRRPFPAHVVLFWLAAEFQRGRK